MLKPPQKQSADFDRRVLALFEEFLSCNVREIGAMCDDMQARGEHFAHVVGALENVALVALVEAFQRTPAAHRAEVVAAINCRLVSNALTARDQRKRADA